MAQKRAWIDVRVTDLPVGQLLRELKTLRSYAPYDTLILVVMNKVDPDVRKMLGNEGFVAVSRAWLEKLE